VTVLGWGKLPVLITGGAGFIGSNLVQYWIDRTSDLVVNVDKLTYAGNLQNLAKVIGNPRHIFLRTDIGDTYAIQRILANYKPRAIINLAAESHVDRSIHDPDTFIQTNVVATLRFLKAVCASWNELAEDDKAGFRFLHVSTDEYTALLTSALRHFEKQLPMRPTVRTRRAKRHRIT